MMLCPTCHTHFKPRSHSQVYCKPTCTASYIKAQMAKATRALRNANESQCATCGEFFHPRSHNHIYCMSTCRPVIEYVWVDWGSSEPAPFGYVHPEVLRTLIEHHHLLPSKHWN